MLFNSLTFLLFFCVILSVHYSPIPWRLKKTNLLLGSYLFYAAWNPPFVLLLLLSTVVDWHAAKRIDLASDERRRRIWLGISLALNLGLLAAFKYSGFLLENFNRLLESLGVSVQFADPGFILPVGISFYTFQTLSYTLDIYYGKLKPWHSFLDYALYVSFFPQLVAGPIVRAKHFLPQAAQQNRVSFAVFSVGLSLLIIGLFEKTVLADTFFGPLVDRCFEPSADPDTLSAWLGGLFFSAQIFCDFAGYSLCAIGCAMCLGFDLPWNFRSPFAAVGFSDLWRRWHVSLSSWLRDYLYIPLGGNRHGRFRTYRNLLLTMLLGGLWHGAAWTFVIWGLLHGLYLVAERGAQRIGVLRGLPSSGIGRVLIATLTFLLVTVAFVIFRAQSLDQAVGILSAMFGIAGEQSPIAWDLWTQVVTASLGLMLLIQWRYRDELLSEALQRLPAFPRAVLLSSCLLMIVIASGDSDAFIYFQF